MKLHALVGTKTNIIAACKVTDRKRNDSAEFKPLVEEAAQNFDLKEVPADKAYISYSRPRAGRMGHLVRIPFLMR